MKSMILRILAVYPNDQQVTMMYKSSLVSMVVLALVIPIAMAGIPFIEFFNGMAAQQKGKSQMTYGRVHGEELLVERMPVLGTIHRDYIMYPYNTDGNTIKDALRVGSVWSNPLPRDINNMKRGQELYNIYCVVCHGKSGMGDGSVTGPDRFPAPPSLHTDAVVGYEDGTIFHIISKGIGKMPAYSTQLNHEERWQVVHYLRALQRSMKPHPEDL